MTATQILISTFFCIGVVYTVKKLVRVIAPIFGRHITSVEHEGEMRSMSRFDTDWWQAGSKAVDRSITEIRARFPEVNTGVKYRVTKRANTVRIKIYHE